MNPNLPNSFSNPNAKVVQYRNSTNIGNSPLIETTHYSANQIPSQVSNFQTVPFEQGTVVQSNISTTGFRNTFRVIKDEEMTSLCRDRFVLDIERYIEPAAMTFVDDPNLHVCPESKEDEEYIVYKLGKDGKPIVLENVSSLVLSERQEEFEQKGYKVDYYTKVLKDEKNDLIDLENYDFTLENQVEVIYRNLRNLILTSAVRAIDYSRSFKQNYLSHFSQGSLSKKDVELLRAFIAKVTDKNHKFDLRAIGQRPELKKQYISLAIFLLAWERRSLADLNFGEMEAALRTYITEVYKLRQETISNYSEWLRQLVEHYHVVCQAGNLRVDNTFLSTINIDLFAQAQTTRVEYRESGEYMQKYNELLVRYNAEIKEGNWMQKYNDLLAKYNADIKQMDLTIYNLRQSANSTNIQVQEVNNYFQKFFN